MDFEGTIPFPARCPILQKIQIVQTVFTSSGVNILFLKDMRGFNLQRSIPRSCAKKTAPGCVFRMPYFEQLRGLGGSSFKCSFVVEKKIVQPPFLGLLMLLIVKITA